MRALPRTESSRIAEIGAELATLRIGTSSAVEGVMPAIRELLDVENMLAYSVVEQDEGWQFERWHYVGTAGLLRAPLSRLFALTKKLLFYDPRAPHLAARNRVVEAVAWIDRDGPGNWYASQLCREVFVPLGMQDYKQLRVLVCDGAELLAWFGTLTPGPVTRRHARLLAALVPAIRRRVSTERRLASAPRTFRALEMALEQIGSPTFVVGVRGRILEANASGRRLLARSRHDVAAAIEAAQARRPHPISVELTPISAAGMPQMSLATVRAESRDTGIGRAVAAAAARWQLTRRQRDVLGHIVRGDSNATISAQLGIGTRAVELHVTTLLARVTVANRAALAAAVLAMEGA